MGGFGDMVFGSPSKSKQNSTSESQYTNQSNSASQSGNLAYPSLSQSLGATTNFTPAAGNWLAALLGIPMGGGGGNAAPPPAPSTPENPPPLPPLSLPGIDVTPPPLPETQKAPPGSEQLGGIAFRNLFQGGDRPYVAHRETGGPVAAGQPYIVGEKRPEVFVPHTNGTILPSVPSSPQQDALGNYSKSAGMDFLLNQGTNNIYSSNAAKGIFQSGATGQALEGLRNNLASTYLDNYMNHVLDVAKLGLGSAGTLAQAGQYSNSASQSSGQGTSSATGTGTSKGGKEGLLQGMAQGAGQAAGSAAMAAG